MIHVNIGDTCGVLTLTIDGHAGAGDIGHDLVCASCSILAHTLAQAVMNEEAKGGLKHAAEIVLESGHARIVCEPLARMHDMLRHAYYIAAVGYSLLSHEYPQFVKSNSSLA